MSRFRVSIVGGCFGLGNFMLFYVGIFYGVCYDCGYLYRVIRFYNGVCLGRCLGEGLGLLEFVLIVSLLLFMFVYNVYIIRFN